MVFKRNQKVTYPAALSTKSLALEPPIANRFIDLNALLSIQLELQVVSRRVRMANDGWNTTRQDASWKMRRHLLGLGPVPWNIHDGTNVQTEAKQKGKK